MSAQDAKSAASTNSSRFFRAGLTVKSLGDVNLNDAKASVKAYMLSVAERSGIPVKSDPTIFQDVNGVVKGLRDGEVDVVTVTSDEYVDVSRRIAVVNPLGEASQMSRGESYVVLAHKEAGVRSLRDLRGLRLNFLDVAKTCLASKWLDSTLLEQGLTPASAHFGSINRPRKVSLAVLPVYFRKTEACLVTRSGFETMVEMNPQLGRQLEVVATSPALLTGLTIFREGFDPVSRGLVVSAVLDMHKYPAGKQLLTIFQSDRIQPATENELSAITALVAKYEKLVVSPTSAPAGRLEGGSPGAGAPSNSP